MLEISENRRINRISNALANGKKNHLSPKDVQILEQLEYANNCIENAMGFDKIPTKSSIANKIAEKFDTSQWNAYKILHNALVLFGKIEYPGVPKEKVFTLRRYEFLIQQLQVKINKEEIREGFKVEYHKLLEKYIHRQSMILGNYLHKEEGIDYQKWQRPQLVITNDPSILKATDQIMEKIQEADVEDIDFEDVKEK